MLRAASLLLAVTLAGCEDWSRPDPRLQRPAAEPAPTTAPETAPAPVEPPAKAEGLADLRQGVARLRAAGAAATLPDLERLETLGFGLMERGTPPEQAEAEALLQELSDLRAELVERQARGG